MATKCRLCKLPSSTTVAEAVKLMDSHKHTAVLICDGKGVDGIFTVADFVTRVVVPSHDPFTTPLSRVMTAKPKCASSLTTPEEGLKVMQTGRFRHLPIVNEKGEPKAIIGILEATYKHFLATDSESAYLKNRIWHTLRALSGKKGFMFQGTVEGISSGGVLSVSADDFVQAIAEKMKERKVSALLVTAEGDKLIGIVTERDIMRAVVLKGLSSATTQVRQVMTANPRSVTPATPPLEALNLMCKGHFRHLPIVNGDRVVGILDILTVIGDGITSNEEKKAEPTPAPGFFDRLWRKQKAESLPEAKETVAEKKREASPGPSHFFKFSFKGANFRFSLSEKATFDELNGAILHRIGEEKKIRVMYMDDDADEISLSTTEELKDVFLLAGRCQWKVIKLVVTGISSPAKPDSPVAASSAAVQQAAAPVSPEVTDLEKQGDLKAQESRFEEAVACYKKACAALGEEGHVATAFRLWGKRAQCFSILGQHQNALDSYNMAVVVASRDASVDVSNCYTGMCEVYTEMNLFEAAVEQILLLPEGSSARQEALSHMLEEQAEAKSAGTAQYSDAHYMEAMSHYTRATLINMALSEAPALGIAADHTLYSNRAASYMAVRDYATAITDCDLCLAIKPDFAKAYVRKAKCLSYQGKHADAVAVYDTGLSKVPDDAALLAGKKEAQASLDKEQQENTAPAAAGKTAGDAPSEEAMNQLKELNNLMSGLQAS